MFASKDRRRHRRRISRDISDDIVLLSRPIQDEPMRRKRVIWRKLHGRNHICSHSSFGRQITAYYCNDKVLKTQSMMQRNRFIKRRSTVYLFLSWLCDISDKFIFKKKRKSNVYNSQSFFFIIIFLFNKHDNIHICIKDVRKQYTQAQELIKKN